MSMRLFCYVWLNWMNIIRVKQIPSLISLGCFFIISKLFCGCIIYQNSLIYVM